MSTSMVLATLKATTGSATMCWLGWQQMANTSWSSTCSHARTATGTTPSTVRSEYCPRQTTTSCRCLGTRVMPTTIHSSTTTVGCSPRMTVTTTSHQETAPGCEEADSGTKIATGVESTMLQMSSVGLVCLEVTPCWHLACGWSASRLATSQSADEAVCSRWTWRCHLVLRRHENL